MALILLGIYQIIFLITFLDYDILRNKIFIKLPDSRLSLNCFGEEFFLFGIGRTFDAF